MYGATKKNKNVFYAGTEPKALNFSCDSIKFLISGLMFHHHLLSSFITYLFNLFLCSETKGETGYL